MNAESKKSNTRSVLRLAIPNKGRIADPIIELIESSGLKIANTQARKLIAMTSDPEIEVLFARPIDIPEYVAIGAADIGITGRDMVMERGSVVDEILDLHMGGARLVLAVSDSSNIQSVKDLDGLRIATEFPGICERYFKKAGVNVELVPVSGACEAAPYLGIADGIVDLTSSGTTLVTNKLHIVDEVLSSTTILIGNKDSRSKFSEKIDEFCVAIESVLRAKGQRYLMLNVKRERLEDVKAVLPGLSGPTIMDVSSDVSMVAVHAVVSEEHLYSLISALRKAGAQDLLVVPIERMIR